MEFCTILWGKYKHACVYFVCVSHMYIMTKKLNLICFTVTVFGLTSVLSSQWWKSCQCNDVVYTHAIPTNFVPTGISYRITVVTMWFTFSSRHRRVKEKLSQRIPLHLMSSYNDSSLKLNWPFQWNMHLIVTPLWCLKSLYRYVAKYPQNDSE